IYYHQGKIYFAGDAYFPQFGVTDTNFSLLFLRGVVGSIDTSGTIIQTKIFEEDAYFPNGCSNVFVQKDNSIIICAIYGTHVIQPGYYESQEFILDNNFKTIKSIKSTEKDSVFSYARVINKSPTNEFTCFKKYQLMSQKGDIFSRTNYGYLIHYDENMKVKDSSAIDFFYPSNINNNNYNVYALANNPLNDSLVTFFGTSSQNSSNPYFYAVNVNRNGHAVDSIHIPRYPKLACELKYDVSTIFFNSFDTITITTDYHQRYNDPVTEVKELVKPDSILMIPYPNPAHKNLCFEYFNLIDKVGLFTMQGTQIEDLKQDGNCFVLPENFQEGIYYVKITMKNSTIHYSRVKLLRY
ncbi:MAG: T9SS type A sorting domain-containing protein, partial [Burkholderiales bacterium]|nr:T9SS type A sorting domain-containing protein [Bacteroidia bacterium]